MSSTVRERVKAGAKGSDHFQTPPQALCPLLPYLRQEWRIWEPSCGAGSMVRALRGHGRAVIGTDVMDGVDFVEDGLFAAEIPDFDCILTNPPYSIKDRYLERCYHLGKPFALLLPITALGGGKRQKLYAKHGIEIILLGGRINFLTPSGQGGGSWFEVAWFTHGLNIGAQLTFARAGR